MGVRIEATHPYSVTGHMIPIVDNMNVNNK